MSDKPTNFCQGITKDGKPCKARPTKAGLCYFHSHPDQARILGQKGGRGNRYQVTEVVVPENATGATLGTLLDQAIGELLAGRMNPRVASAFAQLVKTRRDVAETTELEARVTELEGKLAGPGSSAAEELTPSWWMPPKNGNEGGGEGNGNNGKA